MYTNMHQYCLHSLDACVYFSVWPIVSESHGAQATEQLHGGILQNLDIWKKLEAMVDDGPSPISNGDFMW